MKRRMKSALGHAIAVSRLSALLLRNSAVVVAFHRVNDRPGTSGLSLSVSLFERYCRYFREHFHVVPLRHIVERLEQGGPLGRELAITFDDGYRDNFENAAPILERLALPATFFVVTQWIGSDVVPWWDAVEGTRHPWMTWSNVRALHDRGFEIGAHTRTHVDLGAAGESQIEEEVLGARRDLETRLEARVELFAYPYGKRENLRDRSRRAVKEAGFRCCCSCHGGLVTRGAGPFELARVPITPRHSSPYQFGFDIASGRSEITAG
ncbi:MAG TPA: polysaccharide deacetylase family protein [Vicinamibacterales bacterium]|nr:polysaccharide deacetylase family protein [Vicinamibacterales bacterium]